MAKQTISFRLLESLTTALYEDPIVLFREYVQNSLDAYNNEINNDKTKVLNNFSVNITIDKDNFNIEIVDNGYGIKEKEFVSKMKRIGESDKKNLADQIGFRGIGRLSAMPLCRQLIFENKPLGINKCLIFVWDGEKFNELLNKGEDINATLDQITSNSIEDYNGDINNHYFKVKILGYQEAIKDLLKDENFQNRLCTLLPLRYLSNFTQQNHIKQKYHDFLSHDLDKFECSVKLDNKELYKPYIDNDILASGIIFWDLILPSSKRNSSAERIGILWFTFNRIIKARPKDRPYGILVRSKNMLMGDKYALASDVIRSTTDYITTPRELTQALNGVCGEMLINDEKLRDNARRDWFRIDEESIKLRYIISEFMRRLHEYRYAASDYFSNKKKEKIKERLIEAYKGLITKYDPDKFIPDIEKLKKEIEASKEVFKFAGDDIPTLPHTIKKFYDSMMKCLYEYFSKRNKIGDFIEIRATIKKYLTQEPKS